MSFHQALQHPADIKQVSSITEYFTSKSASQVAAKILNLTRSRFAYTVSNLDHCTPLICALLVESFDCAALLIAAGADPTIPNKNGTLEILGMQTADRLLVGVVCYYLLNEFQFFSNDLQCFPFKHGFTIKSGGSLLVYLGPRRTTEGPHHMGTQWIIQGVAEMKSSFSYRSFMHLISSKPLTLTYGIYHDIPWCALGFYALHMQQLPRSRGRRALEVAQEMSAPETILQGLQGAKPIKHGG